MDGLSWNFVDQAISSLGTAVSSFILARSLDADEFGIFGISFIILTLLVSAARSLGSQPYAIYHPLLTGDKSHYAASSCLAVAAIIGVISLPIVLLFAVGFETDEFKYGLIVFGVLQPMLLTQDAARSVLLAQGRPRFAATNDLATSVVQIAACLIGSFSKADLPVFILLWASGSLVGSWLGCHQLGVVPRPIFVLSWARETRGVSVPLLGQVLISLGVGQLVVLGVGAFSGAAFVGAIRAGQTLLGPLSTFGLAVTSFALPRLARRAMPRELAERYAVSMSGVLMAVTVVWGLILLLLPSGVGVQLLGDSWFTARQILPALLAAQTATAFIVGPNTVLAACGNTSRSFRVAVIQGALLVIFGLGGAIAYGGEIAVLGLAVATALACPYAWHQMRVGVNAGPSN